MLEKLQNKYMRMNAAHSLKAAVILQASRGDLT